MKLISFNNFNSLFKIILMNFEVKFPVKLVSLKIQSNSTRHKMLKINNKRNTKKERVTKHKWGPAA